MNIWLQKAADFIKKRGSIAVIFLIGLVYTWTMFNHSVWKKKNIFNYDVAYYYVYTPATWLYQDLGFRFKSTVSFPHSVWYKELPNGKRHSKMSCGSSLFYTPFFFIGHAWAKSSPKYLADGYTNPYQITQSIGGVIYVLLGLIFIRKTLKKFFSDKVAAITLLSLGLATNLFYYGALSNLMSHIHSFLMFSVFLWGLINWWEKPKAKWAMLVGLSLGLIVIIRPSNAAMVLLPIWLFVAQVIKSKMKTKDVLIQLLGVAAAGFIPVFIQMLYWKLGTGDWILYSYTDEGFFFLDPKIWEGLFGFRKGWLIYSPIMVFAILGLFLPFGSLKAFKWPLILALVLEMYIMFSWWCWWYGGSFGMRPMIDILPVLAIPMAIFFTRIWETTRFKAIGISFVVLAFIGLNGLQTVQHTRGFLHYDAMNWPAYKAIFLKKHTPSGFWDLIDEPDYEAAKKGDR